MIFAALSTLVLASVALATDIVFHLRSENCQPGTFNEAIDYKVTAKAGWLWLNYPSNATCDSYTDHAEFTIHDGVLNLYTRQNDPVQQAWVYQADASQLLMGYTTGDEAMAPNAQRTGWVISDKGLLQYNGANYFACPGDKNGYTLWVNARNALDKQDGCFPVSLRVYVDENPVRCRYTSTDDPDGTYLPPHHR